MDTIPLAAETRPPVLIALDRVETVRHLLEVCGISATQHTAVTDIEGIQDIAALRNIFLGDVKQMTQNLSRLAVNRGGAYIGTSLTAKIKDLIWWIQDAHAQGETFDPNDWDNALLDDARKRMLLEKQGRDLDEDIVDAPKRLDPTKWVDSYLSLIIFLRGQTSADGKMTLDYVVRKPPPLGWTPTSREVRLKYKAPLAGPF
jgi:hypothetical protein